MINSISNLLHTYSYINFIIIRIVFKYFMVQVSFVMSSMGNRHLKK